MRVLIVDDDEIALELLGAAIASAGYEVSTARDGCEALETLRTGVFRVVITDWEMPNMDGIELCRKIRERQSSSYVYVILVTSREGAHNVVEGLDSGADDFITKPFHPAELALRVRSGMRLLSMESCDVTIFTLAKLAESRSAETGAHLERMREYCRVLAEVLSHHPKYRDEIDADYVNLIYRTSPLHDIGKVGVPDAVLLKAGPLTDAEFQTMKLHVRLGAETLEAAAEVQPDAEFLRMAREIVLTHHERYDGSGYPQGLTADEIPLCGRIVALADVYDALTVRRVYQNTRVHDLAKAIILESRGVHFDPDVVDAFLEAETEFINIQQCFADYGSPPEAAWSGSLTQTLLGEAAAPRPALRR
ncbi:MAG TPA: response regulator [Planctomycetaceae bacterium]|nr:response regulator [Planctomycetaceae bacterium]